MLNESVCFRRTVSTIARRSLFLLVFGTGFAADPDCPRISFGFTDQGFGVGPSPRDGAVADFNGDGFLDLAVGSQDDFRASTISVILSRGDGTLEEPRVFSAGERLSALASGDLDGDGDPDLASVNSSTVQVLRNQGDATFESVLSVDVPASTRHIAVGDVSGDGNLDLLVTNTRDDTISVLLGTIGIEFSAPVSYGIGAFPTGISVADIDGDNDLDVLAPTRDTSDISILTNAGDGSFEPLRSLFVGGRVEALVVADVDGDSDGDLVAGTDQQVLVFRGEAGNFGEPDGYEVPVSVISAGDFDGDGDVDLASGRGNERLLALLVNPGDGLFDLDEVATTEFILLEPLDIDADGDEDIALLGAVPDRVNFLLSGAEDDFTLPFDTSTLVAPVPQKPHSIVVGDFNRDGLLDVATSNGHDVTVSVFHNSGEGTLTHAHDVHFEAAGHLNSLVTSDLDGDGDLDIAAADREAHRVGVLIHPGDGPYPAPVHYETDREPFMIAAGDLNGDGAPDLVTANKSANNVTVLFNLGDGTFARRQELPVESAPFAVAIGDLDADGLVDLVAANDTSQSLSLLFGAGEEVFREAVSLPILGRPTYVIAVDLDADGDLDLATALNNAGTVIVHRNRGDGTFETPLEFAIGRNPYSVIAADVNSDGILDLATVDEQIGSVSLLVGRGDATYPLRFRYPLDADPRFVGIGDFNGDGHADVVGINRRPRNLTVHMSAPRGEAAGLDCSESVDGPRFVRGDVSDEGDVNLGDVLATLNFLFQRAEPPGCVKAADTDDDGRVDVSDAIRLVSYLFRDGTLLPEPVLCGIDPTPDPLPCAEPLSCGVSR